MQHKYGEFRKAQVENTKQLIRKQIYFLLLIVDPKTKEEYENIDVNKAYDGIMRRISGLNELLFCPTEIVTVLSLLEAALIEYNNPSFDYYKYRKLVLDAGNEILKVKEV